MTYDAQTKAGTWFYNSSTSHSFKGMAASLSPAVHGAKGPYNCLAFVLGILNEWVWPWKDSNGAVKAPSKDELRSYMAAYGFYTSSDTLIRDARVIYYYSSSILGNTGHFAKVVAWDSLGYPTKVQSKLGPAEVLENTGYDVFRNKYGGPYMFFK
ncbi:MAG: hypothetical protein N3B21_05930 [Clostridia bacterium]|nr:hypothetical protein [Clostridia bacterium]